MKNKNDRQGFDIVVEQYYTKVYGVVSQKLANFPHEVDEVVDFIFSEIWEKGKYRLPANRLDGWIWSFVDTQSTWVKEEKPKFSEEEYNAYFDKFFGRIHSFLCSMTHDADKAKALAFEVFERLYYRFSDSVRSDDKIRNWLYTTAKNRYIDDYRKKDKTRLDESDQIQNGSTNDGWKEISVDETQRVESLFICPDKMLGSSGVEKMLLLMNEGRMKDIRLLIAGLKLMRKNEIHQKLEAYILWSNQLGPLTTDVEEIKEILGSLTLLDFYLSVGDKKKDTGLNKIFKISKLAIHYQEALIRYFSSGDSIGSILRSFPVIDEGLLREVLAKAPEGMEKTVSRKWSEEIAKGLKLSIKAAIIEHYESGASIPNAAKSHGLTENSLDLAIKAWSRPLCDLLMEREALIDLLVLRSENAKVSEIQRELNVENPQRVAGWIENLDALIKMNRNDDYAR